MANDARGIPLARVCPKCRAEKLSHYRPDVLTNSNYEADEPIEEARGLFTALVSCETVMVCSEGVKTVKGGILRSEKPYVLCVDVGGPAKIGWADDEGRYGTGANLGEALDRLAALLVTGSRVALGFEAPIWTPLRAELDRITSCRGGVETTYNPAWSAGAGTGALGAALALMPWCLTRIAKGSGPVTTTLDPQRCYERGGLFLWEAFVSGAMKVVGTTHHDDAQRACEAFVVRWPGLFSDIPPEPAVNHAVSSAMAAGLSIDRNELVIPALVVAATAKTAVAPVTF
jgi:hypothetical protein